MKLRDASPGCLRHMRPILGAFLMAAFLLIVMSTSLFSCATRETGSNDASLADACLQVGPQTRDDEGRTVIAPRAELRFKLPLTFAPSSAVQLIHGGLAWRAGDRHLTLGYGYWGEESFSEARESCTAVIGGVRLRVFTFSEPGRTSLAAWAVGSGAEQTPAYDIVLGYSSATPGDELLAKQIFASVAK